LIATVMSPELRPRARDGNLMRSGKVAAGASD
jgi:hypothetical protein